MICLYNIFFALVVGTSLFAMNKKDDNSGAKEPRNLLSCHMKPKYGRINREKDTGTEYTTYKYADGSKSTYITYKDSPDKKI